MSMTLRYGANTDETTMTDGPPPEAETRMRRALGLLPSSAPRPRSRGFDGPVVVEHRGERSSHAAVNRVAVAEAALAEERHAREQLARQLRDVETSLREAQTKFGHAELAHGEALAALAAERAAREAVEEQLRQVLTSQQEAQADRVTEPTADSEIVPAPRRRGRPLGSKSKRSAAHSRAAEAEEDSDGAIAWWIPGWQERL
jgi:hypothetical protein